MRTTLVGLGLCTFCWGYDNAMGTFLNPGPALRPRYRYWLPDASVDPELMSDDIIQLSQRVAGGIEFLNYFNYGGEEGPAATDWSIYGYATPAYLNVLKTTLQTIKDNNLVMDFSIGPQSGQGVPAEPDNPGLAWELVSYNVSTPENSTYSGQLPGWGEGDLVSAVTFAVLNATNVTKVLDQVVPGYYQTSSFTQYLISSDSLTDVTGLVDRNGSIAVTASKVDGAQSYVLYASYARRSYARACIASSDNPQNILQNGSFAVDHFSATGAKVTTDFLEQYILIDGIKELMMEAGHYIWEDSVEIPSYVYWTPELPQIFEQQHGYSILKYAPLLAGNEGFQAQAGGPITFVTDAPDQGAGVVADFRSTLTSGLEAYLGYLTQWSNSYLGLEFSQQVGYNLPVDMLAAIPSVNAPECETLSFDNLIDGFRQFCGPANLAGEPIISIELGAQVLQTYWQSWTVLLSMAKRAFVAGVNEVVIHGATYSHAYANTTWPGFTSFNYLFSAQHSRHQPAWDVGYTEANNYLARVEFILQSGTPKVDLVFWDKQTAQSAYPGILYEPTDLAEAGYTYQYLSPENFALSSAFVSEKLFAPTNQAFRAFVIRGNDTLTPQGVEHLSGYARQGLPIVISGGIPTNYAATDEPAIAQAEQSLQNILGLENVHQVPYGDLASVISEIGVVPRTQVQSNGSWFTKWHEYSNGDIYVLVYNDGNYSNGTISFETTLTPYFLNAWTGEQDIPVVYYTVENGRTIIPFTLLSTETAIVKFSNSRSPAPNTHVLSSSESIVGFYCDSTGGVEAKATAFGPTSITLSSEKTVSIPAISSVPSPFSLTNWTVTVEQWLPPSNLSDVETLANQVNSSFALPGPGLPSWSELGLVNVSGIGYYTTTFTWSPPRISAAGAYLVAPPAAQGLVGYINGQPLPAFDITNPILDVSSYLRSGENTVTLVCSTTLWNGLIPVWENLLTGGIGPEVAAGLIGEDGYPPSEYGIVGEVRVVPYELVKIV